MKFVNVLKKVYSKDSIPFLILSGVVLLFVLIFIQDSFLSKIIMFLVLSLLGGLAGYFYKYGSTDNEDEIASGFKKGAGSLLIIITFITWAIGPSIDLKDKTEVSDYLQSNTFEYVDYANNVTSFIEFSGNTCFVKGYVNGSSVSNNSYEYSLGRISSNEEKIQIEILGNMGDWSLKDDGNIYMWNAGDVHIYYP